MRTLNVEATLVNNFGKLEYKYKFTDEATQNKVSAYYTKADTKKRVWFTVAEISALVTDDAQLLVTIAPELPIVAVGDKVALNSKAKPSITI